MRKPQTTKPPRKRGYFFLFLILLLSFSVSGYTIVHYDDFSDYPEGINGSALRSYDWLEYTGCGLNCTYVTGDRLYISTGASLSQIYQKFNLVNDSYCISSNGTASGNPRNFSLRFCLTPQSSYIYTSSDVFRNCVGQGSLSCTGSSYGQNILYINVTSFTDNYVLSGVTGLRNYHQLFNLDKHCVQMDYYVNKSGSNFVNWGVAGYFDGVYNFTTIGAGTTFQCFNTSVIRSGNNMYYDDFMVIVYDASESFLASDYDIPSYILEPDNQMPEFSFTTFDENSLATTTIARSTETCNAVTLSFSNTTIIPSGCNPLYLVFDILTDPESDSINYALTCDYDEDIIIAENFDKEVSAINTEYVADCDWQPIQYARADLSVGGGVRFRNDLNCTTPSLSIDFQNNADAETSYRYLYNSLSIMSEYDITPTTNAYYQIEYINYNFDTVLFTELIYNSTSMTTQLIVNDDIIEEWDIFDNTSVMTIRAYMNGAEQTVEYRIMQGTETIYTVPIAFDWSYPLRTMIVKAKDTTGAYYYQNQLFGNFSMLWFTNPTFQSFTDQSILNCSSMTADDYRGILFITDDVHSDNILNYEIFSWNSEGNINPDLVIGSEPENVQEIFDQLFMGSDLLKYLFSLILFLGIVFGSFTAGAYLGNAMAGAIVACFAGAVTILFLTIFGILPVWFAIVVFLIVSAVIAIAVRNIFVGGGGGE